MPLYLDVGVVRIQEYIMRTSGADAGQLRKRRGASQMISAATAPESFAEHGLAANTETYATEGVAHLVATAEGQPPALAESCLAQLRSHLPQAHLAASWANAASYAEARPRMERARTFSTPDAGGAGALYWLPPTREEPIAEPCRGCGTAVRQTGELCRDCESRDRHGGPRARAGRGGSSAPLSPERRVRGQLSARLARDLSSPRDLSTLAALGAGAGERANHVATIYADGNNIGGLFRSLTEPAQAIALSRQLDEAITEAGLDGLEGIARSADAAQFPAAVTILAADDALITVPANLGWQFVITLVESFNATVAAAHQLGGQQLPQLSLTAGVVFSHAKSPIERAIHVADATMRNAKSATKGQTSMVGWADITAGSTRDGSRRPLHWFTDQSSFLDDLARMPSSQRQKWRRDIDAAHRHDVADADLRRYLTQEATRLGLSALQTPDVQLADITAALEVARWWRPRETWAGEHNND